MRCTPIKKSLRSVSVCVIGLSDICIQEKLNHQVSWHSTILSCKAPWVKFLCAFKTHVYPQYQTIFKTKILTTTRTKPAYRQSLCSGIVAMTVHQCSSICRILCFNNDTIQLLNWVDFCADCQWSGGNCAGSALSRWKSTMWTLNFSTKLSVIFSSRVSSVSEIWTSTSEHI